MSKLLEKPVSVSAIQEQYYKIFPEDLNASNTMFGGQIMAMLDRVALVVAERHSEQTCVTVAVNTLNFLGPAQQGDILLFQAALNRSWRTSMEVGVRVFAKNYKKNLRRHIASGYFIFVAVDDCRAPIAVPCVLPESADEKRRYEEAGLRREYHQRQAKALMQYRAQDVDRNE